MQQSSRTLAYAVLAASAIFCLANAPTFATLGRLSGATPRIEMGQVENSMAFAAEAGVAPTRGVSASSMLLVAGVAAAVCGVLVRGSARVSSPAPTVVPVVSSTARAESYLRDQLISCCAVLGEAGAPSVEETDKHIHELEQIAKQTLAAGAAAVFVAGSPAGPAAAYPIFAQQNYASPEELTGKIVCANCHLASKKIEAKIPHEVLADTIFKTTINIPAKYEKRMQPLADGTKGKMNVGAVVIFPEGFKLAPKDRLPKALKKELKGLSWAPYSKEKTNCIVAGPVPGEKYSTLTLPVLAPDPSKDKNVLFTKYEVAYGGNRGRGQVYPDGSNSNNNQYFTPVTGTVTAVDGLKVSIQADDGNVSVVECGAGADIVVEVGEKVTKEDPITTNPNVGGFGQDTKDLVLQDMNRVYAFCAIAVSFFIAQLAFVLKKKQFEKVQLAEGF